MQNRKNPHQKDEDFFTSWQHLKLFIIIYNHRREKDRVIEANSWIQLKKKGKDKVVRMRAITIRGFPAFGRRKIEYLIHKRKF